MPNRTILEEITSEPDTPNMDIAHSKLGEAINSDDNTTSVVPMSERRGPVIGALAAAVLSKNSKALETVCSLSSIVLPCATMVFTAEWFITTRGKNPRPFYSRIPEWNELPAVRWSALIAFIAGSGVGLATAGIVPALESLKFNLFLQTSIS